MLWACFAVARKWGKRLKATALASSHLQWLYAGRLRDFRSRSALIVRVRGRATLCPRCTGHQLTGDLHLGDHAVRTRHGVV